MPVYRYRAVNAQGRAVAGEISADNAGAAREALSRQSLLARSVTRKPRFGHHSRTDTRILIFSQSLHALLEAGLDFLEAMEIARDRLPSGDVRHAVDEALQELHRGQPPSRAFEGQGSLFGPMWIAALEAGEASGRIADSIGAYVENLDRMIELKRKATGALVYPSLLMIMVFGVVVVLTTVVVPRLSAGYDSLGTELPLLTRAIVGLSDWAPWLLAAGLVLSSGAYVWVNRRWSEERRAALVERALSSVPMVGIILLEMRAVTFSATLSMLLSAGHSAHGAVKLLAGTERNAAIRKRLTAASESLERGLPLTHALLDQRLFPESAIQIIEAGEKGGNLSRVLDRVASFYRKSLDASMSRFVALIEPALMLVVGIVIGLVVVSVYLPVFSMTQGLS